MQLKKRGTTLEFFPNEICGFIFCFDTPPQLIAAECIHKI